MLTMAGGVGAWPESNGGFDQDAGPAGLGEPWHNLSRADDDAAFGAWAQPWSS